MLIDWKEYRAYALEQAKVNSHIPIFGKLTSEICDITQECIHVLTLNGCKCATFLIDSGGGSNDVYTQIKSIMSLSGMDFTGLVTSFAASNAFHLLQACDIRLAMQGTTLLLHWGETRLGNNALNAIMGKNNWPIERIIREQEARMGELHKRTGIEIDQLYAFAADERLFTAEEACNLNFLDRVITGPIFDARKQLKDLQIT